MVDDAVVAYGTDAMVAQAGYCRRADGGFPARTPRGELTAVSVSWFPAGLMSRYRRPTLRASEAMVPPRLKFAERRRDAPDGWSGCCGR